MEYMPACTVLRRIDAGYTVRTLSQADDAFRTEVAVREQHGREIEAGTPFRHDMHRGQP